MKKKNLLKADYFFESIYDIPVDFYHKHGIKILFVDLDNTLTGDESLKHPDSFLPWVKLMDEHAIEVIIVSNNRNPERVEKFVGDLPLEWYANANKQDGILLTNLLAEKGLTASVGVAIGDRVLTDVVGGNKAGLMTIVTKAHSEDKHPFVKPLRFVEQLFIPKKSKEQ